MNELPNINNKRSLILGTEGKFLFIRHGETYYNKEKDLFKAAVNPNFIDSRLDEKGINDAINAQSKINNLDIIEVYVSPYLRTLQTANLLLSNHPNISKIIVIVHPLCGEVVLAVQDFTITIKEKKEQFNMSGKVKFCWDLFDEYVKGIKYKENLFFFSHINNVEENTKERIYKEAIAFEEKGNIENMKNSLIPLAEFSCKGKIIETAKHAYERFKKFKSILLEKYKDSLDEKNKKVLVVTHGSFINIGSSPYSEDLKDEDKGFPKDLLFVKNLDITMLNNV